MSLFLDILVAAEFEKNVIVETNTDVTFSCRDKETIQVSPYE